MSSPYFINKFAFMFNVDKRFIFTHPPKCAGTSIEYALGEIPTRYLEQHNREIQERGSIKVCLLSTGAIKLNLPFVEYKHSSLSEHINALNKMRQNVDEYFIFSCIRNPWDRAVSRYYFDGVIDPTEKISKMTFEKYIKLKHRESQFDNILSFEEYVCHEKKYLANDVIKFERLQNDFDRVCKLLNCVPTKLEKFAFHTKRPCKRYQDYYTDLNTKNMVEEMAKYTIETFGYKFD